MITWPTDSLDLDPLENVWMILKDHVRNGIWPNNKEEMVKSVEQVWEAISMETLEILVTSMPHQIKAIINTGGSNTRW